MRAKRGIRHELTLRSCCENLTQVIRPLDEPLTSPVAKGIFQSIREFISPPSIKPESTKYRIKPVDLDLTEDLTDPTAGGQLNDTTRVAPPGNDGPNLGLTLQEGTIIATSTPHKNNSLASGPPPGKNKHSMEELQEVEPNQTTAEKKRKDISPLSKREQKKHKHGSLSTVSNDEMQVIQEENDFATNDHVTTTGTTTLMQTTREETKESLSIGDNSVNTEATLNESNHPETMEGDVSSNMDQTINQSQSSVDSSVDNSQLMSSPNASNMSKIDNEEAKPIQE